MTFNPYDPFYEVEDTSCSRCNTGLSEHSCWRQEVSGRIGKVPEPIRQHEAHAEAIDRFQYGKSNIRRRSGVK